MGNQDPPSFVLHEWADWETLLLTIQVLLSFLWWPDNTFWPCQWNSWLRLQISLDGHFENQILYRHYLDGTFYGWLFGYAHLLQKQQGPNNFLFWLTPFDRSYDWSVLMNTLHMFLLLLISDRFYSLMKSAQRYFHALLEILKPSHLLMHSWWCRCARPLHTDHGSYVPIALWLVSDSQGKSAYL